MYRRENGIVWAEAPERGFRIGLTAFFLIAFLMSWLGAGPMVLASWLGPDSVFAALGGLDLLMIFGTLIAALAVTAVNYGWRGVKSLLGLMLRFRVHPVYYLLTLGGPVLLSVAAAWAARFVDPELLPFRPDVAMLVATAQIFLVYLIVNTEEIAWRGYALPQMQRVMTPLRANLLLSVIWGVFHLPLFLVKGGHPAGYSVVLFAVLVVAIGLIAGALFNRTGGSVLVCHLFHQALNATGEGFRLFPLFNDGSPWPFRLMVLGLAGAGLWAARDLAKRSRPDYSALAISSALIGPPRSVREKSRSSAE